MDKAPVIGGDGTAARTRKLLLAGFLILLLALFFGGSLYAGALFIFAVGNVEDRVEPLRETVTGAEANSVEGAPSQEAATIPSKEPSDSRFAFLLMGYGGAGHDGAYLTDSMMVVIADPVRKTLAMLSLPRDAWAPLVFSDKTTVYNKLNTAYAFALDARLYPDRLARYKGGQGAGTFAMDTVSRLLGIPVSYYVALDFAGFREMIDAVGGVDVFVPVAFRASYPANDDSSIDPSWTIVSFAKGQQHMGGERAIQYARAREVLDNYAEGSDFARSRRQRLIMEAFEAKLFQPEGLARMPQLLGVAAGHLDTNYNVPTAVQTAQMAMEWKDVRFYQAALTNENYLTEATGLGGAYILVPRTPDFSWSQVWALTRRLWQDPELGAALANTEIVVENNAGAAGVAGMLGTVLSRLGYRVGTPAGGGRQVWFRDCGPD